MDENGTKVSLGFSLFRNSADLVNRTSFNRVSVQEQSLCGVRQEMVPFGFHETCCHRIKAVKSPSGSWCSQQLPGNLLQSWEAKGRFPVGQNEYIYHDGFRQVLVKL